MRIEVFICADCGAEFLLRESANEHDHFPDHRVGLTTEETPKDNS